MRELSWRASSRAVRSPMTKANPERRPLPSGVTLIAARRRRPSFAITHRSSSQRPCRSAPSSISRNEDPDSSSSKMTVSESARASAAE